MTDKTMPEKILVTDVITATAAWQPADTTWDFGAYKNYNRTQYTRSDTIRDPQELVEALRNVIDFYTKEVEYLESIKRTEYGDDSLRQYKTFLDKLEALAKWEGK